GTVLDGKYEVLERLGGGGMGEVYLVRHLHLEEKRVVKILRADRVSDRDAQKRFLREAKFATQIKHPNVAILYDYSRLEDGSFYMVWEHIEGEDVGTRLRSEGPFAPRVALELATQALRGLNAIHVAGMIHRDVSPDNLMLFESRQERPRLKIIDLGLAKNLEADPDLELSQDGMFMGKLLYCAPEQAGLHKGETLDHRTDLYSFGLVLYEMLTGLPPWEAETPQGSIFKRLSEDPLPLVGRNPAVEVPLQLERVVLRALARDREDRFPDAVAFIEAVQGVARTLDKSATQEVPLPPPGATAAAASPEPPPASAGTAEARAARELSRAEKEALLARIERAARRVREGSKTVGRVEALLAGGRLDEARAAVRRLEAEEPRARSLPALQELLAAAEARAAGARPGGQRGAEGRRREEAEAAFDHVRRAADEGLLDEARAALKHARELVARPGDDSAEGAASIRERMALQELERRVAALERAAELQARTDEAAAMFQRYLKKKQLSLARLAFETLIDLSPTHRKRTDFESWLGVLAEEVEQERRADEALASGRAALERGDFRTARRHLAQLRKADEARAPAFDQELATAEREAEKSADFDEHRERIERLLQGAEVADAQQEIEQLAELGAARVTVELYRSRLDEVRTSARDEAQAEAYLEAFRGRIEAGDFTGAREVAGELQRTAPGDPRSAELLAEVAELERARDRRRAIEQGETQVERFIEQGEAAKARLALTVLLQMAPEHKKRRQLEKRISRLKKR
ncbi:MAG TPA: protein kinase, partial [Thermoanaerobaculia bacterium]|nr:protein kinase [Thermoanaerobaculia bacterium]